MANLKETALEWVSAAGRLMAQDIEAMSHEDLAAKLNGNARAPYDFIYETAFVNRRIANRIAGEEPEPFEFNGWMEAPQDFHNKEAILAYHRDSITAVTQAIGARNEDEMLTEINTPSGPSNALKMAHFANMHTMYHAAQLNLIQMANGDAEMHWD